MKYTSYILAIASLSLLSLSSVSFAATGDMAAVATGSTTATGSSASLEVKGAPVLVNKTTNSVTLQWDKVPAASAYIVKYSKASVANSKDPNAQYDNETDQVTATGVTISKLSSSNEKLLPGTAYYFSVVAIDADGKESDTFSDELMVMTESGVTTPTATPLAVKDLVVIDDMDMTLSFSSELSADPVRVKVTKTSDNSDVVLGTVTRDAKNLNTVLIRTVTPLLPSTSYTLTVLSAKDATGGTIQEGVSGLKEFTTSANLKSSGTAAAATTEGTGATAAPAVTTKVETGAKENVIVLAALILSLGIVYIYRRKLV